MVRSLRSTDCSTQPSLAAISALVNPSIFPRATARRVASRKQVEEAVVLVGHLRRELGGRFRARAISSAPRPSRSVRLTRPPPATSRPW